MKFIGNIANCVEAPPWRKSTWWSSSRPSSSDISSIAP